MKYQRKSEVTIMPIEDVPGEIRARIRDPNDFSEIYGYTDIDADKGIRAIYGKLKEGGNAIQAYRFNKTNGWTTDKARKWLKDHDITTLRKDGVLTLTIHGEHAKYEESFLSGIENIQLGEKTVSGRPIKLYDITDSYLNSTSFRDMCDTKIVLFGDVIKNGFTVDKIKLGVIGRRNRALENLAIESLPEHVRGRVRIYSLKDDKLSHIPLIMSSARLDCKTIINADYPWDQCIADQKAKGYDDETAAKICGAIKAANNSLLSKDGKIELIAQVYAVKSIDLNHQELHQYLLGIPSEQIIPLGLSESTNLEAKLGDKLKVACKYVDVHRDADNNRLWFNGSNIEVLCSVEDFEDDPKDIVDTLLWSEGYKSSLEYPKIFDVRARTGTVNNEWESYIWALRAKQTFNEALDERVLADTFGMKPTKLNKVELKNGGRWTSQIHMGNDKYPIHTDLRLEANGATESWMIMNRGVQCKCNDCAKNAIMCEAHLKTPQSLGWLKPINDDNYEPNGEGTYELGRQDENTKEYILTGKSGMMDGTIRTVVLFKRKTTEDGDVWYLANPQGLIQHITIENDMEFVEVVELAQGQGININVIALAEGLWNGRWYPADELPKVKLADKTVPARINHLKDDAHICGDVNKLWYEKEHKYNDRAFPAAMETINVTKPDTIEKIKNKKIKSVSIGADVELSEELVNNKIMPVCRSIVIKETSFMDGIEPACDKCDIQNKSEGGEGCSKTTDKPFRN